MGFNASKWAWEVDLKKAFDKAGLDSKLCTSTTRSVLSFLAHVHNDIKGGPSFYSYSQMADKCLLSRRAVIQHCGYLEQIGILNIKRNKTQDGSKNERNHFFLNIKVRIESPIDEQEIDYSPEWVVNSIHQGSELNALGGELSSLGVVNSVHPKKEVKKELNKETNNTASGDAVCNDFWLKIRNIYKQYGFKPGNKQQAISAFKKLKLDESRAGEIIKKTESHLSNKRKLLDSGEFAACPPHIVRWIKHRGWEDELEVSNKNVKPIVNQQRKIRKL